MTTEIQWCEYCGKPVNIMAGMTTEPSSIDDLCAGPGQCAPASPVDLRARITELEDAIRTARHSIAYATVVPIDGGVQFAGWAVDLDSIDSALLSAIAGKS